MAVGVMQRLEDLNTVLGQTNDHRHRVLVAAAKNIKIWFVKVRKIKAIYHTLNLFNLDVTQKCLIAECWIPTGKRIAIKRYDQSTPRAQLFTSLKASVKTYKRVSSFSKCLNGTFV